jgi:hypothetical protein
MLAAAGNVSELKVAREFSVLVSVTLAHGVSCRVTESRSRHAMSSSSRGSNMTMLPHETSKALDKVTLPEPGNSID